MADIRVISDLEEFRSEITRLHDEIEAAQERMAAQPWAVPGGGSGRVRFEELDLSPFRQDMLSVHKTLQSTIHNYGISRTEARKARLIAIAGMCELVKDEYVGKFWDLYIETIGRDKDSTVYEWIWDQGFKEAGIEMLGGERREFVQTLVMESGVPKNRAADIIDFFEIYWRYLRGRDVFNVIQELKSGALFAHIPQQDRRRLKNMAHEVAEFSRAFAQAVSRLSAVFEYISDSPDIVGGSISDWTGQIFSATGINPLTVLRDGNQLNTLYDRLLGVVTPEKLSRIVAAKPPGTLITTPEGRQIRSDQYLHIQLGRHKIDGALFTCLPTAGLELSFLASRPLSEVFMYGGDVFLRSFSDITPVINGSVRTDLVRRLYDGSQDCGNLFFCRQKAAMEIALRTADGAVDTALAVQDGFVCFPYLNYQGNSGKNEHFLTVRVNSIRLAAASHKEMDFCFSCSHEKGALHEGETDRAGRAVCAERSVLLEHPEPGEIVFSATDGLTDEVLTLSDGDAKVVLNLDVVMLFSPFSHQQIQSRQPGKPFLFGSRRFVLFVAEEVDEDELLFENCEIELVDLVGGYRVCNVTWKDQSKQCLVQAELPDGQTISWAFEKCLHFNLYLNRTSQATPAHVNFRPDQGCTPADFELVLNPFPTPEIQRQLFWNIIVNDSAPAKIPLPGCCPQQGLENTLHISGYDLAEMVMPLRGDSPQNAEVEIALCALDETLVSRRIFFFPDLKVILPDGVRDGEKFAVQVDLGDGTASSPVYLKNPRGRGKVRVQVDFEEGEWRLGIPTFQGHLEVDALETTLDIEAIPPCRAVRFGNRDKGKAEPAREIFKRELGLYDLLVMADSLSPPEVVVNEQDKPAAFMLAGEGLWWLPLTELAGIVKQENEITISTPGLVETFTIKYRLALLEMKVEKYLVGGDVCGTCSFRGPENSRIELRLMPVLQDGSSGDSCIHVMEPGGQEIHDSSFVIQVARYEVSEDIAHYELMAVLFEPPGKAGHEYGARWEVLPESAVGQDDFVYLKEMISRFLAEGKIFAASKHLTKAEQIVPPSEQAWLSSTAKRVKRELVRTSVDRVSAQIASVLRKEFQFEVKM